MATFNKKRDGWEWTAQERQARQAKLRQMLRALQTMREQARRIGLHLPQFKSQAEQALAHLVEGLGKAMQLNLSNRGRKYQPLSPDQFDQIDGSLEYLLKPWQALGADPAFVAASRLKNREIEAHNAAVRGPPAVFGIRRAT